MTRTRRGFTLIEVLIAVSLLAMIGAATLGSFQLAWEQKQQVEAEDERYAQVRGALDRIANDLAVAFLSEHYDRKRYRERPTLFKGLDRGRRDELTFTAFANERMDEDSKTGDQTVLKYFVERDPENNRVDSLFRRTNPVIDEDAERRGRRQVLCEDVKNFELEYWDAAKNEWTDEWDASRTEHFGVLPERVRVTLSVVDLFGKEQKFTTQAQIMMQRSLDF